MARRLTPGTRATDTDRTAICTLLDDALADGQLSMEEHRDRIAAATSALTLGELHALLSDLQLPGTAIEPLRRAGVPGWVVAAVLTAVVVVVGGVIAWQVSDRPVSPVNGQASASNRPGTPTSTASPTTAAPAGPRQLHSVGGVTGLLDTMRTRFGGTEGYELSVYTDYAELVRPDTDDDRFTARWRYEAGSWTGPGKSPNSPSAKSVDLSAFDAAAVLGVIRGAPQTMDVAPMNVIKTWFTVGAADDPTAPEALTVHITVVTSFGTGLIDLDGAGNVKRVKQPF